MNNLSQTERVALISYALELERLMYFAYELEIDLLGGGIEKELKQMLENHGVEIKLKGDTVEEMIVRDRDKFDRYLINLIEYEDRFLSIRVEENRE